jgi:hypothetical protein
MHYLLFLVFIIGGLANCKEQGPQLLDFGKVVLASWGAC